MGICVQKTITNFANYTNKSLYFLSKSDSAKTDQSTGRKQTPTQFNE